MSRVISTHVSRAVVAAACVCGLAGALSNVSCKSGQEPASQTYFDREISPILQHSCSRQTTGCHTADSKGNSVGNLDTTSFDMIDRRHDLLVTYGPYSAPGLLTKVGGPQTLTVSTPNGPLQITTDIRHAAGSGIDVTSEGYATLRRWMDGGASADNVGSSPETHLLPSGDCNHVIPSGFDPAKANVTLFDRFKSEVQPVIALCSASSCHGNTVADFQLVCPDDDDHIKWNQYIVTQFLSDNPPASEFIRRPLDPARGGVFHEGGIVFDDPTDPKHQALVKWANDYVADPGGGPPTLDTTNAGLMYFANRVQPTLVRKGCMFLGCHSAQMFHDLRLRGGSGGQFSVFATNRNYEMAKLMLAIESPDPAASRIVAKNLYPYDATIDPLAFGVRHRGGALFEDFPDTVGGELIHHAVPADCSKVNPESDPIDSVPAYCVLQHWHQLERDAAIKAGPAAGGIDKDPISGIVYVQRPPNKDVPQAFDTYEPGATLHIHAATMDPATGIVTMGTDKDVTAGCGLSEATADIRGPAVSYDALTIAFAARSSASEPLTIYTMKADGSACAKEAKIGTHDPSANGILEHDFDPTFLSDGRIVFASSRGTMSPNVDYNGQPTRTPSMMLPNSNIFILDNDGTVRALTFLLDAELAPEVMRDGRIVMTTEKRAPGFYQLAGRRINPDGGDYHPLYAQRKSLGFEQMTEIHELADRSFVGVLSDKGALAGGGTIGVVNRSLGPDQDDRDPNDRFYLHSLNLPDPAATGKAGGGGAYRSPAPLPGRSMIVSYAAGADVTGFDGTYELVQMDERNGKHTPLVTVGGKSIVEAVAIYARPVYPIFTSRFDEVNGATQIDPSQSDAQVHYLDVNLLSSLLFQNTRTGRPIDYNVTGLGVLEEVPPDGSLTSLDAIDPSMSFTDDYGKMFIRRRRITGGLVSLAEDGSVALRLPGGVPLLLELYEGNTLSATQREEIQYGLGERVRVGFRRDFFDAQCGGCHGSISAREVDVHLKPDVLTSASRVAGFAVGAGNDFDVAPGARGGFIAIDPGLGK
jgi:hypothetical protein